MSRNYRFARLAGLNYLKPIHALYRRNPELARLPYTEQQKHLFFESYVYTDGISRGMRALGHEAHEITHDCEMLQRKWAEERGLNVPENWQEWIALEQLREIKPDVVYFQDIHGISLPVQRELKRLIPSIKLLVIHKGFPGDAKEMEHYDLRFFGCRSMVRNYQAAGIEGTLMYHSFDDATNTRLEQRYGARGPAEYELTFLGSSGFGYGAHKARFWQLVRLALNTPIELWIDEPWQGDQIKLNAYRCYFSQLIETAPPDILEQLGTIQFLITTDGQQLNMRNFLTELVQVKQLLLDRARNTDGAHLGDPVLSMRALLPTRCKEPLFGLEMYHKLQNSKVVFNRHSDAAYGDIGNMRMFQATGVGSCLLTDTGANMSDLFEPDSEVVTYKTTEEAIEKYRYLCDNPSAREAIAKAGQRKTLSTHTAAHRAQFVDEFIQRVLSGGVSETRAYV